MLSFIIGTGVVILFIWLIINRVNQTDKEKFDKRKNWFMETYKCNKCGMAVNASCASCDEPLRNDYLILEDGNKVQISICPSCEGKIKSPQCCGEDMLCEF